MTDIVATRSSVERLGRGQRGQRSEDEMARSISLSLRLCAAIAVGESVSSESCKCQQCATLAAFKFRMTSKLVNALRTILLSTDSSYVRGA